MRDKTTTHTEPRECAVCNAPFFTTIYEVRRGYGRYCSRKCYGASLRTHAPRICEACGAQFATWPEQSGHRGMKYCSRTCYHSTRVGIAFFANVPKPVAERFWAKVNKGGPTIRPELGPCWLWTAGTTKAGYGVIGSGGRTGKMTMAHRLSWEMHNGPIPAGLHVCHKCDNPPCVNPDHLFTGTVKRNSEDMVAKGRSQRGTTHWRAQLSEDDVRAIRTRYGSGEGQRALASEYGIHWMTVFRVIHRKLWAHVA